VADPERTVPAPALRETSDIWFDTGRDPVVVWDPEGRRFLLVDPVEEGCALTLLVTDGPVTDPARVAQVLADGLAACDFPPTGQSASPTHVERTLRAAGLDPRSL
jgi:hypothetical protein